MRQKLETLRPDWLGARSAMVDAVQSARALSKHTKSAHGERCEAVNFFVWRRGACLIGGFLRAAG